MRVLIVDDDASMLRTFSRMIETFGYEPRCASSVATGFAAVLTWSPDALLLDVRFEHESGFDLLAEMRAHEVSVPVVMISGEPTLRDADEARRAGVVRYLSKPVDLADLHEALEAARHSQPAEDQGVPPSSPPVVSDPRRTRRM